MILPGLLLACQKKDEAQPAGGQPAGGAATQPAGSSAAQPTGAAATQPAGAAASQPARAATQPAAGDAQGKPFTGLVKLAEGTKPDAVKDTDVLFIMARERLPDGKPGRLIAVQRHGKVDYPFRYELGMKDLMMPGMAFSGPFLVQARLDRDGDPMTRGAEDLYAEFDAPVHGGQEGVHLPLGPAPTSQK